MPSPVPTVLTFIDIESSGLDPSKHEILEIAIIRETSFGVVTEWCTKVKPQHIETAHPKALEVNGYTPEAWADAPLFGDVADKVAELLEGTLPVGQNPHFDLGFIKAAMALELHPARIPYHVLDTVTLIHEHLVPQGLESLSLVPVREFLGWSTEGAHTALQDARDARRLYYELIGYSRASTASKAE